jgi:hypothetical protein
MSIEIIQLSAIQLRRAADIKEEILMLETTLVELLGALDINSQRKTKINSQRHTPKRTISASHRQAIIKAQKARWAKANGQELNNGKSAIKPDGGYKFPNGRKANVVVAKKKPVISAAGKAKIAAAQKARWAKINAAKKPTAKIVKKAVKPVIKPLGNEVNNG